MKWLFIAAGGAIGSVLRYAIQSWMSHAIASGNVPLGTLTVNVVGSFVLGAVAGVWSTPHQVREEIVLMITTGVLGGFTTFSTFAFESFGLAKDGQPGWAAGNVALHVILGLAAVWAGYSLGVHGRG